LPPQFQDVPPDEIKNCSVVSILTPKFLFRSATDDGALVWPDAPARIIPASWLRPAPTTTNDVAAARLHVGDTIVIHLRLPDALPSQDKPSMKTATSPCLTSVRSKPPAKPRANWRTSSMTSYVPRFYTHLTVTVKAGDGVYYVRGEVKLPWPPVYVGQITVPRPSPPPATSPTLQTAAKSGLRDKNGQRYKINCDDILNGDAPDPASILATRFEVSRRRF